MKTITYSNHDQGATGGSMIRDSYTAWRTADLLRQCGYQSIMIDGVEFSPSQFKFGVGTYLHCE